MTAPVSATAPRPATPVNTRVLGGLLLVFGTGWLAKQTGIVDMPWSAVASLVLVALGLAMVATARSRARTVPLMLLGVALTAGLAIGSSNIDVKGGFGDRTFTPTSLTDVERYSLGFGSLTVDLGRTPLPEGEVTTIRAEVGFGHLLVKVPSGVAVRVEATTKFGNAVVFGQSLNMHGKAADTTETEDYAKAATKLRLILKVGFGQIDVSH